MSAQCERSGERRFAHRSVTTEHDRSTFDRDRCGSENHLAAKQPHGGGNRYVEKAEEIGVGRLVESLDENRLTVANEVPRDARYAQEHGLLGRVDEHPFDQRTFETGGHLTLDPCRPAGDLCGPVVLRSRLHPSPVGHLNPPEQQRYAILQREVDDELFDASVELGKPRFTITRPVVERSLFAGRCRLVADRDRAVLSVTDVATFAVAGGTSIRLQPEEASSPEAVTAWLHGTVAALLLAQRGLFALHASVVSLEGRAVAIAGNRSAGKTTAALRLARDGGSLVTDDVSALLIGDAVTVQPSKRPVHVHPDTAATLALDLSAARPIVSGAPKLALPSAQHDPVQLTAIVVLEATGGDAGVATRRARGAPSHRLIWQNIYRVRMLQTLWRTEMFAWAGEVASRLPVYRLCRPPGASTIDEVAYAIARVPELAWKRELRGRSSTVSGRYDGPPDGSRLAAHLP